MSSVPKSTKKRASATGKGKVAAPTDAAPIDAIVDTMDNMAIMSEEEESFIEPTKKPRARKSANLKKGKVATDEELVMSVAIEAVSGLEEASIRMPITIEILNATKVQQFKTIFQNIKSFSRDVNIYINTDSLYVQCMDNSKVSVFELTLPAIWFDRWVISSNTVVGVSTALFFNILNLSENSILIEHDPIIANDKLCIELRLDKCTLAYELPLMSIESDMLAIPDTDHMVDMNMRSAFFFNIVDKLKKFGGETFDIECTEESVKLFAKTKEAGKMTAEIKIEDLSEYAIADEKIVGSFAMSFIYNIAMFHKVADNVEVHFTNGEPLKVIYGLDADTESRIVFYLAPKIDVNEEEE